MLKPKFSIIIFAILFICTISIFYAFGNESEAEICRAFLKEYGWETQKQPHDRTDVTIPAKFDAVYENYNKIQKNAGLDLTAYCGKKGVRYSFVVTNYPIDVGETVYANVLCINGLPVGGDIMTVSLNGFMHALNENIPQ